MKGRKTTVKTMGTKGGTKIGSIKTTFGASKSISGKRT
jgi:hypothetical protein